MSRADEEDLRARLFLPDPHPLEPRGAVAVGKQEQHDVAVAILGRGEALVHLGLGRHRRQQRVGADLDDDLTRR